MTIPNGYSSIKRCTPQEFEGRKNERVLIIASGHSTKGILKHKKKIRCIFDAIIVCNYSFQYFDDISDYHIVSEKTSKTSTNDVYKKLSEKEYRLDVPRIVNWKGLHFYPDKYNLYKTLRSSFNNEPDIRRYRRGDEEGLLTGKQGSQGFSLGSVLLCTIHFASIIGANEIYTIGADMCFKDEFDHFYSDDVYRKPPKKVKTKNAHKIVEASVNGQIYKTTAYFKESAEEIDRMIVGPFSEIKFFDFSDGLLNNVKKIKIDKFIEAAK